MRTGRILQLPLILLGLTAASSASPQAPAATRVTDHNRIALTVSNYGAFGNNFVSRSPSFEFPFGTGYEHMPDAGIWIGAHAWRDGIERVGVTTGAIEGSQGTSLAFRTEFQPWSGFEQRSRSFASPFYHPATISESDLLTSYRDDPGQNASGSDAHVPLGVHVAQEVYAWSTDCIVVRLRASALRDTLRGVYVGLYSQLASGPRNSYSTWPPSSSGGGSLGSWYSKKLLQWDPNRHLLAEHYCNVHPTCSYDIVPPWVGVVLLGTSPDSLHDARVGLQIWNWSPGDTSRDTDSERYALLGSPHQAPADSLLPGMAAEGRLNDPVELLATGPFDLAPGVAADTVEIAFAFVGGETYEALLAASDQAQAIHDAHYRLPEVATRLSLVDAEVGEGLVRLRWHSAVDAGRVALVERSVPDGEWTRIGEATVDATGLLVYEDHPGSSGGRYGYRAGIVGEGGVEWTEPKWIEVPAAGPTLALLGGPTRVLVGSLEAEFSLPVAGPARLDAFDVRGRRVATRDLDGVGPGVATVRLAPAGALRPGVYFLRLSQGNTGVTARALLLSSP